MKILRSIGHLFLLLAFFISLGGQLACGGGGGGSTGSSGTGTTATFAIAIVAGEGTTTSQASVQVEQGKTGSVTVGLLSGYENLVASGVNATISGTTCTFGPVNASGTVTLSATKIPPTTFTVAIVAGEGTTASQTSVQVEQGKMGSVNVGLLSGYENLVASGLNAAISGTTCTFGPVTANGTVTLSATKIIVPPTYFTVTIVATEGTTTSQTSVQVVSGQNGSVNVGLLAGYENLVASGLGATISGNVCTFGPVTANGTVTLSATKIIVPPTYFTVTIVAGEGTTTSQTSVQVVSGQYGTVNVGLLAGYENLMASGVSAALSGSTCTFGPVTADGTVTLSATKIPTVYHTVAIVAGEGTTTSQAFVQVVDGQMGSVTVGLLPGYSDLYATGLNATVSGNICSFGPVNADGTVTLYAATIVYHKVTSVVSEGTTQSFITQQVADRQSFTSTGGLLPGYSNLVLSAPGGAQAGNSITIASVTGDVSVTSSATKDVITDVPALPGKIVFVVTPDILTDMTPLINQFMSAVAADTGCESILLSSPSTPTEIRTYLQSLGTDLRMAFFIGDVPMIYNAHDGLTQLSDHYYRALRYPFGTVYTDANGRNAVDITSDSNLNPSWRPTNAISRIKGLSTVSQLSDIRSFLEKDLLMRNNDGAYQRGTTMVNATDDSRIDGSIFLAAYTNHPLFSLNEVTFKQGMTAQENKDSFYASLNRGEEISQILIHGAPSLVAFRGQSATDQIYVTSDQFNDTSIHSKYISLESCSTGDFSVDNYLAGALLFGNQYTLLVSANTVITFISDQFFSDQARRRNFVLGAGRSFMTSYPYEYTGDPIHYFGDPTITIRKADLTQPHPRMVIQNKQYHQEFTDTFVFLSGSQGEEIYQGLVISNPGDRDLVIKTAWQAMDSVTVDGQIGSFFNGNGFYFPDYRFSEGSNFYCTITVPAGSSKVVKVAFEPYQGTTSTNGLKLAGTYRNTMTLFSNDPEIGAFELVFTATVK